MNAFTNARVYALNIQVRLYTSLAPTHPVVVQNFKPQGWYECDVFAVNDAGEMVECEIKITHGDFKNDAKKFAVDGSGTKHQQVASGHPSGPARFYYVCPERVILPDELPAWAGLRYVGCERGMKTIKEAPLLHSAKCDSAVVLAAYRSSMAQLWRTMKASDKGYRDLLKEWGR